MNSGVLTHDRAGHPLDIADQGRRIVESQGGRWVQVGGMCRCPAHADATPSLSVRVGDRNLLFHCFAGCETGDVLRALRRAGLSTSRSAPPGGQTGVASAGNRSPLVDRLWSRARDLPGTLAAAYLGGRGLAPASAQLRFHPQVPLGPASERSYHPALLAAVRDDDGLVAVHRTFLDPATGAKARLRHPRRMLGMPGRGAARFGVPAEVLGLAEGLETALAASVLHRIPVWAVLGNERFGAVAVPGQVRNLIILADNDAGGARAATLALAALQRDGRYCDVVWPPRRYNDWADVLMATRGEDAVAG